jgi:hypothetical protein
VEPRFWSGSLIRPRRIVQVEADSGGGFTITNLPPGDYWAAAVAHRDARDWPAPALLARVTRVATRLAIGAGEVKRLDLSIVVVSR